MAIATNLTRLSIINNAFVALVHIVLSAIIHAFTLQRVLFPVSISRKIAREVQQIALGTVVVIALWRESRKRAAKLCLPRYFTVLALQNISMRKPANFSHF